MSVKFDTTRITPQSTEPQLTAFIGVGAGQVVGASSIECGKLLHELNVETARYAGLVAALGTTIDSDGLRKKLKYSRVRVWDRAIETKNKLVPLLRRQQMTMEGSDNLDRLFRILLASLEFLEELYRTTLTLQIQFSLKSENSILINTGSSEASIPRKGPDKDKQTGSEVTSIRSISNDLRDLETDETQCLQKELNDMHDLVFTLNHKIAIQTWEVDPERETEKCTVDIDKPDSGENNGRSNSVNDDSSSIGSNRRKMRCITMLILTIILIIIGGIVGILMGMLD